MSLTLTSEYSYFAGANSGRGFVNYFYDIFGDLKHLYIIKGGSGTGKSHLMKAIAAEGEKKGYKIEYFYCSSDPSSLDGIIINDLDIGVIDGTAPHTTDPKYPGVIDEIINVGDFWDKSKLEASKERIITLINKKNLLFTCVYRYLSAASKISSAINEITDKNINHEKLNAAARRLSANWKNGTGSSEKVRMLDAHTMEGYYYFNTFVNNAKTNYIIKDKYNTGYIFLRSIREIAKLKQQPVYISFSSLDTDKENALYLPLLDISFTINTEINNDNKVVNMDRFINNDGLYEHKAFLRFCKKCKDDILEGVDSIFTRIKEVHFSIEKIYISCMNFERKEKYQEELMRKIFA